MECLNICTMPPAFAAFMVLMVLSPQSSKSEQSSQGATYYYQHWCDGHNLRYLDDSRCEKVFPSSYDREFTCDVSATSSASIEKLSSMGFEKERPLSSMTAAQIDVGTLPATGLSPDVRACVVVTKRIQSESGGIELYNKYLCNGADSRDGAHETWSSSKPYAVAQAAGNLRSNTSESGCQQLGELGLDSRAVNGKHGPTQLGDLATIIASYDSTMGYSSNSLSGWFNSIALHSRENDLVQSWLGSLSGSTTEPQSLGGDYGELPPTDIALPTSLSPGDDPDSTCVLPMDTSGPYPNTLSALSHAELVRRLAQHREISPRMRFPNTTWIDIQQILYGTGGGQESLFPTETWGGMTADTAIFVQSSAGVNLTRIDEASSGKWRLFSKLGAGYSTSRTKGEIITNAYACLPIQKGDINAATEGGIEISLSVRASESFDATLERAQEATLAAVDLIMTHLMSDQYVL